MAFFGAADFLADGFDGLPVPSPDGTQLAFTSARAGGGQGQIFLAQWNHEKAMEALANLTHRGAMDADAKSGDGAGVCFFGELIAIGMKERGAVGALVDGGIRDVAGLGTPRHGVQAHQGLGHQPSAGDDPKPH